MRRKREDKGGEGGGGVGVWVDANITKSIDRHGSDQPIAPTSARIKKFAIFLKLEFDKIGF